MPNRIIKESVCGSESIDALSWFEEVFFYRLIVNCDDYGRMDARAPILRSRLFPLKNVTDKQVENALQSLRSVGIVDLYFVDGRPFLQMRTWDKHQQIRAKKSKFPSPVDNLQASDINCNQVISDVPVIQSESESEYENPNPKGIPPLPPKGQKAPFADQIAAYANGDKEIEDLLVEWLKVRKAKRAAMTERAIHLNLQKLDSTARDSGMSIPDYLREVICRGWQAFYVIRDYAKPERTGGNIFLDLAKEDAL